MSPIPDTGREKLIEAMAFFDRKVRSLKQWLDWTSHQNHKYAIFHQMRLYPVKKTIALATKYPLSKLSDGTQANEYATGKGFKVIHLRGFSWEIISGDIALKHLDKSAFLHRGTGVPIHIRDFFLPTEIAKGQKFLIALSYDKKTYSAHIDMDSQDTARTRLFWSADFSALLRDTFPYHFGRYNQGKQPDGELFLKFERLSGFETYGVSFTGKVSEKTIAKDLYADELEDKGPQNEGGVKEYYGKRYERSPLNRQEAIKLHGLTCNICGFNFEKVYGARGEQFIEVHHLKPISTYKKRQLVDPQHDLITVCCNCHKMIHRKPDGVLSIEDMIAIVVAQSKIKRHEDLK